MAKPDEPSIEPSVQQSWDDFVKDYDLVVKFGMSALEEKLNAQASSEGQTYRYNKQQVKEMLASIDNNKELNDMLNESFDRVYQMLSQLQTPRATSVQPQLEAGQEAGVRRKFEPAPWAGKFDIAADANYRNLQNVINDLNTNFDPQAPKDALLNQYKNKLKMDMRQRLENKLALENKLTYTPKAPRPKGPGEF